MDDILIGLSSCNSTEDEYWYHVSSQDELPLAAAKPKPKLATQLFQIAEASSKGLQSLEDLLTDTLLQDPEALDQLRTLVSIPDKRLYLDLSYIFSRTLSENNRSLCGCIPHELVRHQTSYFINILKKKNAISKQSANVITHYLLEKGLKEILEAYSAMNEAQRTAILNCLILPKEMQQVDAKLRGHGPEAELAKLIDFMGCKMVPEDKAANPMGQHDPNVNYNSFKLAPKNLESTFSSDLIVLDRASNEVKICIVGLVHSSDPGQFGVDKANTVKDIRLKIDNFNTSNPTRAVEIWGLVDGVGYSENKNGTINSMLPYFHNFIQVKTLWKAALRLHFLRLAKVKAIKFEEGLYSEKILNQLLKYVPKEVIVLTGNKALPPDWLSYKAGSATIYV